MRGGYIHNRVLIGLVAQEAMRLGIHVDYEVVIKVGEKIMYGDLLIQYGLRRILVEAEMSSKRIANDLAKAETLKAELWILVPNPRVAQSVRRKLSKLSNVSGNNGKLILLLPQAIQRLGKFYELNSGSNVEKENKQTGNEKNNFKRFCKITIECKPAPNNIAINRGRLK